MGTECSFFCGRHTWHEICPLRRLVSVQHGADNLEAQQCSASRTRSPCVRATSCPLNGEPPLPSLCSASGNHHSVPWFCLEYHVSVESCKRVSFGGTKMFVMRQTTVGYTTLSVRNATTRFFKKGKKKGPTLPRKDKTNEQKQQDKREEATAHHVPLQG